MNIFDKPEIKSLLKTLLLDIFAESSRGAILIATAKIETFLTDLIKTCIPSHLTAKQQQKVFNYPGHLSSLSSKIELSFIFRLIDKNIYVSLNKLKEIRNIAAHSSSIFDLKSLNEKMKEVYNLGDNVPAFITTMATEFLLQTKIESIKLLIKEQDLKQTVTSDEILKIFRDDSNIEFLQNQLPHWELTVAVCMIAGILLDKREKYEKILDSNYTWDQIALIE